VSQEWNRCLDAAQMWWQTHDPLGVDEEDLNDLVTAMLDVHERGKLAGKREGIEAAARAIESEPHPPDSMGAYHAEDQAERIRALLQTEARAEKKEGKKP
jgi:hypothetical protein